MAAINLLVANPAFSIYRNHIMMCVWAILGKFTSTVQFVPMVFLRFVQIVRTSELAAWFSLIYFTRFEPLDLINGIPLLILNRSRPPDVAGIEEKMQGDYVCRLLRRF
jgi:hypothetical protein